jgi:hypothetical protein
MEAFRRAAEQSLVELGDEAESLGPEPQLERMSLDLQIDQRRELVSLRLSDGRLSFSCSCGQGQCAHVKAALRFSAGSRAPGSDSTRRSSTRLERVLPELHAPESKLAPALTRAPALAEALEDVVTAVVRAGVASERVASVLETLSRVEREAGTPLPLGVRRWLGSMREALEEHDVPLAAHALTSAAALAADLRAEVAAPGARERVTSWLGGVSADAVERISDRQLLEVGREWVNGTERMQIERRYLIDLNSGEAFREECLRRERPGSVGSCPRLIGVALAEAELGCAPRRMRLLQYTTTPDIDRASWDLLAAWGQRDSEALAAAYRSAQSRFGSLSEPFALAAPRGVERGVHVALLLDRGPSLPLSADDEPGVLRRFEELINASALAWVAGRLFDRAGHLMLRPLAAGILDGDRIRHERL